jgi:hypothetical protein
MFPKPTRFKCERYLDFIRSLPCCNCGKKSDPHHTKTRGSGGSDLTAIPCCRECHTEGGYSWVKFQEKHSIDFKEIMIDCLQKFIEKEVCNG